MIIHRGYYHDQLSVKLYSSFELGFFGPFNSKMIYLSKFPKKKGLEMSHFFYGVGVNHAGVISIAKNVTLKVK